MLIIHRPFRLNTLPFPADILDRLRSTDLPLEQLISTIESLELDCRWEVEDTRVVMSRQKWLNIVQNGTFPPCKQDQEIQPNKSLSISGSDGIRELMTGVLRYAGDHGTEFVDRMVFITVNRARPTPVTNNPAMLRCLRSRSKVNMYGALEMEVTPNVRQLLNARQKPQQKKCSLFD